MAEKEIEIKISRVSTVAPAIPTARHRMFLSNLDLCFVPYNNTHKLLFYKISTPDAEISMIVELLKRSLSLVLVDFYPFAGRLEIEEGESGRPEIECNDAGVRFIEASIDITFHDLERDEFQHKSFFKKLVRKHENSCDAPLLSIQVTDFLGSGICIGITFNHGIADGNSFWYFMKYWSDHSRGLPISNKRPEHMRTIFKRHKMNNCAIPNISFKGEEVVNNPLKEAQIMKFLPDDLNSPINSNSPVAQKETNISSGDETNLEMSRFHFSEEMIRNLKERAGASTSFVAVAAHFWRCLTKARQLQEKEPVRFLLFADCRRLVKPALPDTYFGNCLSMGVAETSAKKLLEEDICFAACLIQELINSCATEIQLNNLIDWVESHPGAYKDLAKLLIGGSYLVDVVGSAKYPVYDINYGWGKPISVQSPSMNTVGGMLFSCGKDNRKSIDICTCLPHREMETLKRIVPVVPWPKDCVLRSPVLCDVIGTYSKL